NNIYIYPDLWICTHVSYGCDIYEDVEACARSTNETEGGPTSATYRPEDEDETTINFDVDFTEKRGWCVYFETSALEYRLGEERDSDDYIDYVTVDMYWYPGGSANNSTTCIQEAGAWEFHHENVYAYLNDPLTSEVSAGIQIAYSCMTNESSSYYFTYVGIGVTKEHKLGGLESASYNALALSTVEHKIKRDESITGIQAPYAYMKMQLQQESDSLVEITEIDPLDVAEILGQVGGFWDLILILWPLLFVAASEEIPNLKPRNFLKSVVRAKEKVTSVAPAMLHNLSATSTTRDPPRTTFNDEQGEELPAWEGGGSSSRHQKKNEVIVRLFEEHGLVAVIKATSRLAIFLQTELGASYLRRGAVEPSLKKLLPAKTFLVKVPTNSTALSVAKELAGRTNSEEVVVKVKRVSCTMRQSQALEISSYLSAGDDIYESGVDLGKVQSRLSAPADSGEGSSQPGTRSVFQRISASIPRPHVPEAISPPARRSPTADVGTSTPRRNTTPRVGDRNEPPPSY
ncbi:unnamed protein product, partial [Ascophyllum nodosum]